MRRLLLTLSVFVLVPIQANAQCDVVLNSFGDAKLNVVKAVKSITGLGLKEAKDLVDSAPSTIAEDVSEEEAFSIGATLEDAGAEVSVECPESESEGPAESACSATVTIAGDVDASVLAEVSLLLEAAGCSVAITTGEESAECGSYTVVLDAPGGSKLNVVKAVKSITGLGLKESKELVDSAPSTISDGLTLEEAESVQSMLEEAGAEVSLTCD